MIKISDHPARFRPGQSVRHRRYGYRGVVVDVDLECGAPEAWYQQNQTQPLRQQPWYHVFVHGTATTTYAAQDNLDQDLLNEPIDHPLLAVYFDGFFDGRYVRNERRWEGW